MATHHHPSAGRFAGPRNKFHALADRAVTHRSFQRRAHHYLKDAPELGKLIEWWALIQHFGGPTRLLDFTWSFYAAAFFAIERASKECAVWCVNSFALFEAVVKMLNQPALSSTVPYWQVSHRVGRIAEQLIRHKSNSLVPFVFEVEPFRLNERLAVQQGVFLCPISVDVPFMQSLSATFGLPMSVFTDEAAEEYDALAWGKNRLREAVVVKILLPTGIQHDALKDLWNMNVSAASLFPGLDGFARSLYYFVKVDNLWHVKYQSGGFDTPKQDEPRDS